MHCTSRPTPARLDRSTVRFNITRCGSRRIIEHRRKRRYRELLREMPHWDAPLSCIQHDDGDWIIVARLNPDLTHGRPQLARRRPMSMGRRIARTLRRHGHAARTARRSRSAGGGASRRRP